MPELRKSANRRWVTDHEVNIPINYLTLEDAIRQLETARQQFAPTVAVRVYTDGWSRTGRLHVKGERYATTAEVSKRNAEERARREAATRERRKRIEEALRVLQNEAPGVLNRTDIDSILEETAV